MEDFVGVNEYLLAFAEQLDETVSGKSASYAYEIAKYVLKDNPDKPYGKLNQVSDRYSPKELMHGVRCFPEIYDEIEDVDDLKQGYSTATTWNFNKIRNALVDTVEAEEHLAD